MSPELQPRYTFILGPRIKSQYSQVHSLKHVFHPTQCTQRTQRNGRNDHFYIITFWLLRQLRLLHVAHYSCVFFVCFLLYTFAAYVACVALGGNYTLIKTLRTRVMVVCRSYSFDSVCRVFPLIYNYDDLCGMPIATSCYICDVPSQWECRNFDSLQLPHPHF